jgi:hypothetical protein
VKVLKIHKVGIPYFQPKIFRLKTGFISKVWILGNRKFMFQRQNRRKYSVQNQIIQSKNVQFRPPNFGHFSGHPKMSILAFARRQF